MIRLLSMGLLLVTLTHVISGVMLPDFIYYGAFGGILGLLVLQGKKAIFLPLYVPMILSILLSIGVNDIPVVFKAPARAAIFLVMVFTVGPFIINNPLLQFRRTLFVYVLAFIRCTVVLSFAGYILRLPMVNNFSGFCGITGHSMILAPLAGIASLNYFYWTLIAQSKKSRLTNVFLMSIAFFTLILSGSRSALGACIVGLFFFLFTMYRMRPIRVFQIVCAAVLLMGATYSIWWPYTEKLREKMEYGEKEGSNTASRDLLWKDRINEFRSFPVFGVGFASYNAEIAKGESSKSGTIEPGSSWLFLLSSMGLMGFLSFLLPAVYIVYRAYVLPDDRPGNAFLGSVLTMFMAHMLFEGYVAAAGSYLCFVLWLFLSEGYYCLIKNRKIILC